MKDDDCLGIPKFDPAKAKDVDLAASKVNAEDKRGTFIHFRISKKLYAELVQFAWDNRVTLSMVARVMLNNQKQDMSKIKELIKEVQ